MASGKCLASLEAGASEQANRTSADEEHQNDQEDQKSCSNQDNAAEILNDIGVFHGKVDFFGERFSLGAYRPGNSYRLRSL